MAHNSIRNILSAVSFLFVLFCFPNIVFAGDSTFTDNPGKVYGRIFSNFHSEINHGDNTSGFEIKRVYFGYQRQLSKYFSANLKMDIGSPEDLSEFSLIRRYAYFKNAYVKYKNDNLTVYFGIIDILHFKMQEKYWAHRYIEKSYNDRYRFGAKADLGCQVIYDFADWISADLTLMNGEGYTKLQGDNTLKSGAGISIFPLKNLVTRVYCDFSQKNMAQTTLATFIGYKINNKVIGGLEYNYRFDDDFDENRNRYGYSGFLSYYPFKKLQLFGRFDQVSSNKPNNNEYPWNLASDGSAIIAGVEFSPITYIKIALNYQDWFPLAKNEENEQAIYLNFEISF